MSFVRQAIERISRDARGVWALVRYLDGHRQWEELSMVPDVLLRQFAARGRDLGDLADQNQGFLADVQAQGGEWVRARILELFRLATRWDAVANAARERSTSAAALIPRDFWGHLAMLARARSAEIMRVVDDLYWIRDTYLDGEEGNEDGVLVDPIDADLGAAPFWFFVVGTLGIVSVAGLIAWRDTKETELETARQLMVRFDSASPAERTALLSILSGVINPPGPVDRALSSAGKLAIGVGLVVAAVKWGPALLDQLSGRGKAA